MGSAVSTKGFFEELLDTLGFLWKRVHLFTFDKPQAEGVESRWTRDLQPIGATEVQSGELVELLSSVDARHRVSGASGIRFDILEEDFFLTGGLDDLVVSLAAPNAAPPQDGFERLPRATVFHQLTGAETLATYVATFKAAHPHYDTFILIVAEPAGPAAKTHVLTWWRAQRVADYANAEMYFLLNIDGAIEDGTEQILDVSPNPSGLLTLTGKIANPASRGVADAIVVAKNAAGVTLGSARTDPSGEYRLDLPFVAALTLHVTHGFATATSAVAPSDANRLEPLVVPTIQVTGLTLTGTVRWPSWIEPPPAGPVLGRGQMNDVSNHFTYTPAAPPVAEVFAQAVYEYDRTYQGMPFGGMDLVVIADPDPSLDLQDWPLFRLALDAAESSVAVASAAVTTAEVARGTFAFDNSLAAGDYLIGARFGYRLLLEVASPHVGAPQPMESNRFSSRADRVAAFSRLHVNAAGVASLDGRPWEGRLFMLPVVEPSESGSTNVPDRLEANLQLASRTVLSALLDSGRVVDMARLDGQFDAGAQEALLKHTAVAQEDGRTTFLFDHALSGYVDQTATERVRLPWVPLTDALLLDAHDRRRDEMTSADFGRYPLKFIPAPGPGLGQLRARNASREIGDDVREVKVRLLLWGSAAESVNPNGPVFDQITERAIVRFKQACQGASTPADRTPAALSYLGGNSASARRLYPNSQLGRSFTGICDLDTFKALGRFISDTPHPELAFTAFRSPGPIAADAPEYGRRGIDRMLIYALESLRRRLGADAFTVQLGVRSWPRHTLDDETRDLSVNHPEGYAVKIRPRPLPATGNNRLTELDRLRNACEGFGAARGKAGPPGLANDLLPPLPVGLTRSLQEGKLLIAPKSWLEQGTDPGELGENHRAPVGGAPSTPWRVEERGVNVQASGSHAPRWDPPYPAPAPAARSEEQLGLTTSGQAAALGAAWQANRNAIERWGRYYGVPAEILLAMTGTESRNFNGRSARVEPVTTQRSDALRDARWLALGCGPLPAAPAHALPWPRPPGPNPPPAPPLPAGVCAAYANWYNRHNAVMAQVNGPPNGGLVPASPAGNALVNDITNLVEAFAPAWVSPGIIQTLVATARTTLQPEFGAGVNAIVTTRWLLDTYDPNGVSNSIRAGAAYIRELVNTRDTKMDPPLVSAGYNAGGVFASPDATNRWRMLQFDAAGGHTNRFVAFVNDCVTELRADVPRVNDNLHYYDDLHLDTFMLHHNAWELRFVVGDAPGVAAPPPDPGSTARTPPAGLHASALARAYTRTQPQLPPPPLGPAPPTAADQATALANLTRYLTRQLESYEDTTGNPGSRVWMRLLWTFAADAVSARGVRWSDSLRVHGAVTRPTGGPPVAGARVEVAGAQPVTTAPSGHYLVAERLAPLPDSVDLHVRVGQFLSRAYPVPTGFPGASIAFDVATLPIAVSGAPLPSSGPAAGGTVVQIDGEGFVPGETSVAIGGIACTAVNAAANRVTATTPAGAAGALAVTITTPSGLFTIPAGFTYT